MSMHLSAPQQRDFCLPHRLVIELPHSRLPPLQCNHLFLISQQVLCASLRLSCSDTEILFPWLADYWGYLGCWVIMSLSCVCVCILIFKNRILKGKSLILPKNFLL